MTEGPCIDAFRRELGYLLRTLRRLGVREADLEDEAHEVFLVLERKWTEYDPKRPLRPFLFGIAFRRVANRRRRETREVLLEDTEVVDDAPSLDEQLDAARARALVLRALEGIPLPRRAVFVMHDIDEVPMREIAVTLSVPMFTGYSRLRKARQEFEAAISALTTKATP